MSEFQYYEFCSIDKPLSDKDRKEIGNWSSRTIPSSRKAVFTYSYGDFPKDEGSVLLKYFDAFFYIANWGTKKLMFKFPKELVDFKVLKQYEIEVLSDYEDGMKIYKKSNFVVVEIRFTEEGGFGWLDEEQPWLENLIPLRSEILREDYRSLFLIWLCAIKLKHENGDLKPNFSISQDFIPHNLKKLNTGLETLIDFFEIDEKLIKTIAKHSLNVKKKPDAVKEKISMLPEAIKDEILCKLLKEDNVLANRLYQELRKFDKKTDKKEKIKKKNIMLKNVFEK